MKRNWSTFAAASVLAGYVLHASGAPTLAIAAGVALCGLVTYRAAREKRPPQLSRGPV